MSGKQIRLQVPPKSFGVNSWIAQMIRQWIPDCWPGDRKCTGRKSSEANLYNWQLMTSGRSQMLATSNFGNWYTVVGEVPWTIKPETVTVFNSLSPIRKWFNRQLCFSCYRDCWHTDL